MTLLLAVAWWLLGYVTGYVTGYAVAWWQQARRELEDADGGGY